MHVGTAALGCPVERQLDSPIHRHAVVIARPVSPRCHSSSVCKTGEEPAVRRSRFLKPRTHPTHSSPPLLLVMLSEETRIAKRHSSRSRSIPTSPTWPNQARLSPAFPKKSATQRPRPPIPK